MKSKNDARMQKKVYKLRELKKLTREEINMLDELTGILANFIRDDIYDIAFNGIRGTGQMTLAELYKEAAKYYNLES